MSRFILLNIILKRGKNMGRDMLVTTAKKLQKRIDTTYDLDKRFKKFGLSYKPLDSGWKSILFKSKNVKKYKIMKYDIVTIPKAKRMIKLLEAQKGMI